ncbi:MAG: hypothetical protein AB7O24_32240 [Kofleriaceae bacterium]
MQATDTSAIHRLIGRARLRIRGQWALEGATTATVLAAACALTAIFVMRAELASQAVGIALLALSLLIIVIGAVVSAARHLDDEHVARRIDRASDLSDRLSTAIAFRRTMRAGSETDLDDETHAMMAAAIRDGIRAAPRADIKAAAPFSVPKDWRAAVGFTVVAALAAGLALPIADRTPRLFGAEPNHAPPGSTVTLTGERLTIGMPTVSRVPDNAVVKLGAPEIARPVQVLEWTATTIRIEIPADAPFGDTVLTAYLGEQAIGPVMFTVVDPKDARYHKDTAVALDPEDRQYLESILGQLKAAAKRENVPELDEFAKKIEELLAEAEQGKITKEQLLDALAKAEEALNKQAEPNQVEVEKAMSEMGKQLASDPVTKELGEALKKNDLEQAKQELEKLAQKLESQQLSEKEKEQLQNKLEQVAKAMAKQDKDKQQKQDQIKKKLEDEIRRLEKKKEQAKTEQEKLDAERRLEKKKEELKKLDKDQQDKDSSTQREALKRLQRDIEKAAENLEKQPKDPNKSQQQQDQEQQERERQASQNLKDAARETGRVDQDQRKQAAQKKMSSQMDDLREAMRRAKQKGNKGPQDPFSKNKNRDFAQRARGQKGSGQGWKPGQGQGQGQGQPGQGQPGGQGQQPGGKQWGTGHDDNLAGDPTGTSGNTTDQDLQGQQGSRGTSRREVILSASQKGFSQTAYKKVYADYERIVEEVMRTEKLPSSYKYYVKRYFAKIHPTGSDSSPPAQQDPPP